MLDLRLWQMNCVAKAISFYQSEKHFFCLATPGAGKSVMAAELGRKLLEQDKVDYIICLSPSRSICSGMKQTFETVLDRPFSGRIGSVGASLTYQSLLSGKDSVLADLVNSRVFVVLDEIHHCSGSEFIRGNAWGVQLIHQISSLATYTLSLSGTPWRTDGYPITFADYGLNYQSISYHYEYGLKKSVNDNVCRTPKVTALDVSKITKKSNSTSQVYSSIANFLEDPKNCYVNLLLNEDLVYEVLKRGVKRLSKLRKKSPNAGGLVVASSYSHALLLKQMLENRFSQDVVLVSYKDDQSLEQIEKFKIGTTPWIVSISMVSEGVDIPRLQVCCHLSDIKTELYFRQVLGRIIRMTSSQSKECYFFTLAEESLVRYAERLEQEVSGSYINESIAIDDTEGFVYQIDNADLDNENSQNDDILLEERAQVVCASDARSLENESNSSNRLELSVLSIESIRERVISALKL